MKKRINNYYTQDEKKFFLKTGRDLKEMDRSFDNFFWQNLGDQAIFKAAWELVVDYYLLNNLNSDELRLQRSIENFQRTRD